MSEEGILLHIPGLIIKVSSPLFSEIKNTYLEGKELGEINKQAYYFMNLHYMNLQMILCAKS